MPLKIDFQENGILEKTHTVYPGEKFYVPLESARTGKGVLVLSCDSDDVYSYVERLSGRFKDLCLRIALGAPVDLRTRRFGGTGPILLRCKHITAEEAAWKRIC